MSTATHHDAEQFDHVIVGAGAAGCVLATRLSADPSTRVLLLEAGGTGQDPSMSVPLGVLDMQRGSGNWSDHTIAQSELVGRPVPLSAGRGLGGGGSINYLVWLRGNHLDYNQWAASGMTGWDWDSVAGVFKRSEHHELGASEFHGTGGPIAIQTAPDLNPLSASFITAGLESGLGLNRDFNGETQDGVGLLYSNTRDGVRDSTATGYLQTAAERKNLSVRTGAHVHRVLFDGHTARGVRYENPGGEQVTASAPSIILAAGALRSPQLLMLSGIGPAEHLQQLGIDVLADRAGVGQNLQDHPTAAVVWPVTHGTTWLDANTPENLYLYQNRHRGPLASVAQVGAFLRSTSTLAAPDIQLTLMLADFTGGQRPAISCMVSLITPRSRGILTLQSSDSHDPPVINPGYLTDPQDLSALATGVRAALRIGNQPSLRAVCAPASNPPPQERAEDYVRRTMISISHPVGTCRAGSDPGSVLDPYLRVRGVQGLRVIDASIMPTITRGNPYCPTVMIGEHASDLILADPPSAFVTEPRSHGESLA